MSGAFGGLSAGKIADFFPGNLKTITFTATMISSVLLIWFTILVSRLLILNEIVFIVTAGIIGLTWSSVWPIIFEYSVELSYPMPEGTTGALVMLTSNLAGFGFVYLSNVISAIIFTWICPLLLILTAMLFLLVKSTYKRRVVDNKKQYHSIMQEVDNDIESLIKEKVLNAES